MTNLHDRFKAFGILRFCKETSKLYVEIENEFSKLYRAFLPKSISWNIPKFNPHISVIRNEEFSTQKIENLIDKEIEFECSSNIQIGEVYIWLNVFSSDLEEIRVLCGLKNHSELSKPPCGSNNFHVTIANRKSK